MKKALVFNNCGFMFPQTAVMLEDARYLKDEGYEIVYVQCGKRLESCFCNPEGYSCICQYCEACHRDMNRKLGEGIRFATLPEIRTGEFRDFGVRTIPDVKGITYRGVYVGYGVLSNYASTTRSGNFEFDNDVADLLNRKLNEACRYVDAICELLDKENPDVISIFNGRFMEQRPFFDLGKVRDIPVRVNEVVPDEPGVDGWRKIVFDGCFPHDIDNNTKMINELWDTSSLSEAEKAKIGSEFYERRKVGIAANSADIVFTKDQDAQLLPEGFAPQKKNIVIFNSSEDEFVSIGREFDKYSLFNDQVTGIKVILDALKDTEYNVILRTHPNLSGVHDRFVSCLYEFQDKYPNLVVIPPTSKVSSYTLLSKAEKVVTFGSTMGIEAVYWGKPSILLRAAYYAKLGGCYKPATVEEAQALLTRTLLPADRAGAVKYGFYQMCRHLTGQKMTHFNYHLVGFKPSFLFGNYRVPDILAAGGSTQMSVLISRFLVKMPWLLSKRRVKWPKKLYCTFRTIVKR